MNNPKESAAAPAIITSTEIIPTQYDNFFFFGILLVVEEEAYSSPASTLPRDDDVVPRKSLEDPTVVSTTFPLMISIVGWGSVVLLFVDYFGGQCSTEWMIYQ